MATDSFQSQSLFPSKPVSVVGTIIVRAAVGVVIARVVAIVTIAAAIVIVVLVVVVRGVGGGITEDAGCGNSRYRDCGIDGLHWATIAIISVNTADTMDKTYNE